MKGPAFPYRHFHFTVDVDYVPRTDLGVYRLLDFCDARGIRGTFFITGMFAVDYPGTVRDIARRGHEVGTHGWRHGSDPREDFRTASVDRQREWLVAATREVEKAAGQEARRFRAPNLWIGETLFALLAELDYHTDSSVPAGRMDLGYGQVKGTRYRRAPLAPYHPDPQHAGRRGASPVLEIPPSACFAPLNMSGLRTLGLTALKWAVRRIEKRSPTLVFYSHPSEFLRPDEFDWVYPVSRRHRRNIGPHKLRDLGKLVDYITERGYRAAPMDATRDRFNEIASCVSS